MITAMRMTHGGNFNETMHNARVGAAAPQPPLTCRPFLSKGSRGDARRRPDRPSTNNVDPKRSPRPSPAGQPTNKGGGEA
jgi:hypothetical protein